MLTCAEDDKGIKRDFSLIYLIGDRKSGDTIPSKDSKLVLPHAAICAAHLGNLDPQILRHSIEGIDKEIYAVYPGIDGGYPAMGYVSVVGISPDTRHVRFISGEDMRRYFPRAQRIILENMLERTSVFPFNSVDQLFRDHDDGILRHFSSDQRERYRFETAARRLEAADRMLHSL